MRLAFVSGPQSAGWNENNIIEFIDLKIEKAHNVAGSQSLCSLSSGFILPRNFIDIIKRLIKCTKDVE